MQRSNPPHITLAFRTKIALIIFGLFLSLVLLETGLRLGGFTVLSIQEYRNRQAMKQKGAYRIMCLGESTTQGQYPLFLEPALNRRKTGTTFSVIDRGISGAYTADIYARLETNLKECAPDMVVVMMGINGGGTHLPNEAAPISKVVLFLRSFRTYKLAKLLWLHIIVKARQLGFIRFPAASLKEGQVESIVTEGALKKVITLNPEDDKACLRLGRHYQRQGNFSQAEEMFKKAMTLNPKNDNAYLGLGCSWRNRGKLPEAVGILRQAIALNPQNQRAYFELGCCYHVQGNFSQAEEMLKKAIALDPKDGRAYFDLVGCYRKQGKFLQAEELLKKVTELDPEDDYAYLALGWYYRKQGNFSQAEDVLKRIIQLAPERDRAYGACAVLYQEAGKPELAREYSEKANSLRMKYYHPLVVHDYRKLKEILELKGIRLVCVQYPMRSIAPLKKIFEGRQKGVIFVDNEKIFKDAVERDGFNAYFEDMFGGDFGHCTNKGNRLLAENIARAIRNELFNE